MPVPSITSLIRPRVDYSPEEEKISAASRTIGWTTVGVAAVAIMALWIWARGVKTMSGAGTPAHPTIEALMGMNLLLGLAAAAAGAVFGFIFGMPRTMTLADRLAFAKAAKEGGINDKNPAVMGVNTNLERISDWLTTLLVGATLVQLKPIAEWIGRLGDKLLSGTDLNQAIVPVIAVLFFSLSFLGIYLITRLYLTSALSLTGGFGTEGHGGSSPEELGSNLKKSLESGANDEIAAALRAVDEARLTQNERKQPALNLNVARALAKLISSNAASGRGDAKAELRAALNNALVDHTVAEELKRDGGAKSLTTGDDVLDAEINTKLNALSTSTAPSKPPLTVLNTRIDDALAAGTPDSVTAALSAINEIALPDETRADPALNAKIVRLVAKAIELKVAPANANFVLREAASRAAKSSEVVEGLMQGLEAGTLTTGDAALDNDVKSQLEAR